MSPDSIQKVRSNSNPPLVMQTTPSRPVRASSSSALKSSSLDASVGGALNTLLHLHTKFNSTEMVITPPRSPSCVRKERLLVSFDSSNSLAASHASSSSQSDRDDASPLSPRKSPSHSASLHNFSTPCSQDSPGFPRVVPNSLRIVSVGRRRSADCVVVNDSEDTARFSTCSTTIRPPAFSYIYPLQCLYDYVGGIEGCSTVRWERAPTASCMDGLTVGGNSLIRPSFQNVVSMMSMSSF